MTPIAWGNLSQAVEYYQNLGYLYKGVPWTVPEEAINLTLPSGAKPTPSGGAYLVGSAEQGFLHLALEGRIGEGSFVSCTPCFRDEPILDTLHQEYFMKVELFSLCANERSGKEDSEVLLADAMGFILSLGATPVQVSTSIGTDIEVNGIEVGSYGYRSSGGLHWAYGTGLAEPRFSIALESRPAV